MHALIRADATTGEQAPSLQGALFTLCAIAYALFHSM